MEDIKARMTDNPDTWNRAYGRGDHQGKVAAYRAVREKIREGDISVPPSFWEWLCERADRPVRC